jgi:dynamin GTPase
VGVLTRVDQAAGDARALSATTALLQGQGPGLSREIPWVATITKAQADVSADESLQGSFQAELDMLRNILGRGQLRLGRAALIDTLFAAIKQRTKQRIPTLLAGYAGALSENPAMQVCMYVLIDKGSDGPLLVYVARCLTFQCMCALLGTEVWLGGWCSPDHMCVCCQAEASVCCIGKLPVA